MTPTEQAAKVSAKAIIIVIAVALVVGLLSFGGWTAYRWAFNRGVAKERGVWVAAQAEADRLQRKRETAAQSASESVSDRTRKETATEAAAITAGTSESVEKIQDVYLQNPAAAAPCRPDGGPGPIPGGVLDELRKAERAATAAARGL